MRVDAQVHTVPEPDALAVALDTIRRLESRLARERQGRKQAESLLEEKSLTLFKTNQALQDIANGLEVRVAQRTNELEVAMHAADAANEAKSRFLALMSHEIRTPLNGVLGLSELLQSTELSAQQALFIKNILSAGASLMALINDILDFSKIEAGEMQLENLSFDPSLLLCDAVELMQVQALAKSVHLVMDVAPRLPLMVDGDPTRVRQVWLNLIGNALKFTQLGSVRVSMRVESQRLICAVKDTGIGMSPSTIAGLFEPFRQADSAITRKFGGTGLGLVICKALVNKMNGTLWVDSVEGRGTCFSFDLPLLETPHALRPEPSGVEVAKSLTPEHDLSALRILLVDDQRINRLVASHQLKRLGCLVVTEAESGMAALEYLRHTTYDVVLMDMQMPEMDGLEATRQLRLVPLAIQPVVIAMTANAYAEDRDKCMAAGMDQFLSKPVSIDTLRSALMLALNSEYARDSK